VIRDHHEGYIIASAWRHKPVSTCPRFASTKLSLTSAITPSTIELALAPIWNRAIEISVQWRMRIERARYGVELAECRYHAVDPANRLIGRRDPYQRAAVMKTTVPGVGTSRCRICSEFAALVFRDALCQVTVAGVAS
jgi:hypothetical protein